MLYCPQVNILFLFVVSGMGFSICIIASYVAMYYNTIIAWALYFLFSSFKGEVPWASCDNWWNTENCTIIDIFKNASHVGNNFSRSPAEEFFE